MRTPGQQSRAVRWVVAAVGRHHRRDTRQEGDPMKPRYRACLAMLGLLALLTGCSRDEEPAKLNAAASVPAATVQKVTQVITPLGSASVAEAGSLPALTGAGESFLLAGDAGNEIYLAAVATAASPAPPFSAESTALALVRLARGPRPEGVGSEAFNAAIRAAAGYEALLTLVRAAGTAGTSPMRDPGVTQAVLTTLGQALQAVQPAAEGRAGPLAMAPVRANAPYPFDILRAGTEGRLRLSVQASMPSAPGVLVANRLPITFGARAEDPNASIPSLPALPPGDESPSVLLPSTGLLGPSATPPTAMPVAGLGRGWNLAVYRTPGARTYDGRELAVTLWNTALQGLGTIGEACQQTVASGWPPGGLVAPWSVLERDLGFPALRAEIESGALLRPPAAASAECLRQRIAALPAAEQARVRAFLRSTEAEGLWQQVSLFARAQWALWLRTLELPDILAAGPSNALGLYEQAAGGAAAALLMHQFWGWATTVGVCQYQTPATGLWQLNPCPTTLELDQSFLELPVGSRYRYAVTAADAQGNPLPLPAGLAFSSSHPEYVRIDEQGVIDVLASSPFFVVFIEVKDPASGVVGRATVSPQPGVPVPPPPPATETLDFQTGVWFGSSYFQGGPNPGTPGSSGFVFFRSGPLDPPLLSQSQGVYVSGLKPAAVANAASDPYFVTVERSDGQPFEALTMDIGLFDNASGSSFQRPALEIVGTLAAGGAVRLATSPESYFAFGAGAALGTVTLPGNFTGLRRLEVKLKLNPNACSSCRVALTVDNIAVR